jgi:hypothetical protein
MTFGLYRAFAAVAKHMNLTKGAETLHMCQPSLSKHLKGLEENYTAKLFTVSLLVVMLLGGCSLPYSPPLILDESIRAIGVAEVLSQKDVKEVDILLIHGMCTHGRKWVVEANNTLRQQLGFPADLSEKTLNPPDLIKDDTESFMEVYSETATMFGKTLRTHAVVWSPATAPWKRRLCYDGQNNDGGDKLCPQDPTFQPNRSLLNGLFKKTLLNDCLTDAMIYVGEARPTIRKQMAEAVLTALGHQSNVKTLAALREAAKAEATPIFIITDSLGSKIFYDTLWKMSHDNENEGVVNAIFGRTIQMYMQANQIPILSLAAPIDKITLSPGANDDVQPSAAAPRDELGIDTLGALLRQYRATKGARIKPLLQLRPDFGEIADVVAFTDPNDLLSYFLKGSDGRLRLDYRVVDVLVSNSPTIFGLFENPFAAHIAYSNNGDVQQVIACGLPIRACKFR